MENDIHARNVFSDLSILIHEIQHRTTDNLDELDTLKEKCQEVHRTLMYLKVYHDTPISSIDEL